VESLDCGIISFMGLKFQWEFFVSIQIQVDCYVDIGPSVKLSHLFLYGWTLEVLWLVFYFTD